MNDLSQTNASIAESDSRPMSSVGKSSIPALGVVIVSFNSGDVILDCLESLLAATGVRLHIVVVDNASTDDTVSCIRDWASGKAPYSIPDDMPFAVSLASRPIPLIEIRSPADIPPAPAITLLHAGLNGGYAAGVNAGLACLEKVPGLDRFWVLNPDSAVPPETPRAFATAGGDGFRFSLMGGRINYLENPDCIQIDGGIINWRTGATSNVNQGAAHSACNSPDPAKMDFISGASMVASRAFYASAGPMAEDYFLYYEEVDWAMQRGDLPLAYCPDALIYHRAGTAIGSPTPGQVGSALSIYFKHRNRMRFLKRYRPASSLSAQIFTLAKAMQILLKGHPHEARVLVSAAFGASPTRDVRRRLSPAAAERAFAPPLGGSTRETGHAR